MLVTQPVLVTQIAPSLSRWSSLSKGDGGEERSLDAVRGLVLLVKEALGLGGAEAAELSSLLVYYTLHRVPFPLEEAEGGQKEGKGGKLTSHLPEVLQTFQPGLLWLSVHS